MSDSTPQDATFDPPADLAANAHIGSAEQYQQMYDRSIAEPDAFWLDIAGEFHWQTAPTQGRDYTFDGNVDVKWFADGSTNVCYNCLDRHLATRADQTAILWEGNEPGEDSTLTFAELHAEVCRLANAMRSLGVGKGDRVCLYMQMVPQAAVAMLACARIGAVHSVVFGAFSADALRDRINDSQCKMLLTQDTALRGKKNDIPMKTNADKAVADCPTIENVIVVKRTGNDVPMTDGRDVWYHDAVADQPDTCEPEWVNAEDPLFILYTSGSTGKPKGVLHTTGGYMVWSATTFKYAFDYHDGDIWWCTADVGWITGHSYIVYGPMLNGATQVMFEGVPTYPDSGRFWDVVEKYKVTQFYTAPTAIRALMRDGEAPPAARDLSSLRIIGSVGEPINPDVWVWYRDNIGGGATPVIDTWWQTETGGFMITPLPGAHVLKPGSAGRPFFGVEPVILDDAGHEVPQGESGKLCIKSAWPGILRTTYGDHQRYIDVYFSTYKGLYFTGDGCKQDADGDYWLLGRVDDVINISGHRLGTAEVESALVSNHVVAEAAVVGFPHDIKGQGIYAYVTLKAGVDYTDELKAELVKHVRSAIGPIATPDIIQWAPGLPKTRSGKIMRRVLRKIAENEIEAVGDVSTLADPSVVEDLIANRPNA